MVMIGMPPAILQWFSDVSAYGNVRFWMPMTEAVDWSADLIVMMEKKYWFSEC